MDRFIHFSIIKGMEMEFSCFDSIPSFSPFSSFSLVAKCSIARFTNLNRAVFVVQFKQDGDGSRIERMDGSSGIGD